MYLGVPRMLTMNCHATGKPRWFMDLNPKGEVPVLVVDGSPIVGSEETVDFLMQGELNPGPQQEKSKRWRNLVNERLRTTGKQAVFSNGAKKDVDNLNAVLLELEACLSDESAGAGSEDKPFLCGDKFTAADASAFPFLQRVHAEFGFPPQCKRLESWYTVAARRPSVKATIRRDVWWWW